MCCLLRCYFSSHHPEKRCHSNPDIVRSHSPNAFVSSSREFHHEQCFEGQRSHEKKDTAKEDRRKFILSTNRLVPSDKKTRGKNTAVS